MLGIFVNVPRCDWCDGYVHLPAAGVAGLPEVTIDSDPYEWCAFAVAPGVARCGECAFGND